MQWPSKNRLDLSTPIRLGDERHSWITELPAIETTEMTNKISAEQFEVLLPLACTWAEQQELFILASGDPLNERELEYARSVGVRYPGFVRLRYLPHIPIPDQPALGAAVELTKLITTSTAGLTLRYGIFIRADRREDRSLLIHELAHTAQYERMGGFEPFLRQYLLECINPPGYPNGPLEQEARAIAARVCV